MTAELTPVDVLGLAVEESAGGVDSRLDSDDPEASLDDLRADGVGCKSELRVADVATFTVRRGGR